HMVVHDLRTPLTALIGGLQTMVAVGGLDELQLELLDMSIQGGQTLLGMINDLLDISKMEDGSLQLERGEVAVPALAEVALRQVGSLAEAREVDLRADLDPDLPTLYADEDKLRRTLVNLLGNALKFTPRKGRVTLRAVRDNGSLVFSVEDTGEGIPKEAFGKIFEKFGQVENRQAGRKNSTGLGLTFCKMATEAHGGTIWVESELGVGSTFSFTIPVEGQSPT
ncbi:MAG: HAMP domain-containing histidine kinase, partial [Armatimonadetes bacterium]|nr:HAMP domain-containing histidine kinase [Armatimonadota bacterium]